MKTERLILVVFVLLTAFSVNAQTVDQEEVIKHRAAEKVAQMNDYISCITNKKISKESRLFYMNKFLNLFMGKGYSYEENGVTREGVMIHIKTKTGQIHSILVRDYLRSLVTGQRSYSDVKIENFEKYFVEEKDTEDGREFIILLGDVTALETKRM